MPALNPQQQNARLAPQAVLPGNQQNKNNPTQAANQGSGQQTNVFAGIVTWFQGAWQSFTSIFNTFGVIGGWFSNPIRVLKMVVGIGLVLVGLILLIAEPEIKALPGQAKAAVKGALLGG